MFLHSFESRIHYEQKNIPQGNFILLGMSTYLV